MRVIVAAADAFTAVSERIKPGVVYVDVRRKTATTKNSGNTGSFFNDPDIERFFGQTPDKPATLLPSAPSYSHGSGFIISAAGYILTSAHVIKDADQITVTLENRRSFPARVIGSDSRSDVGLIKIDAQEDELRPLVLGSSARLKTGEWVLAFGSPYQNVQTVTAGIVSATGRNSIGISDYEDFIQTDAAINPGNSGGPLVNIQGEVIGISTAYITRTGGYMGLGFAIPIDMARTISEQLLRTGTVVRGWLGVALQDAEPAFLEKQLLPSTTRGARVVEIKSDSPAAASGLQQEDLIVSLNETPINGAADLRNRVALSGPGRTVILGYYRNGTHHQQAVTLGSLE
jgi:serine protease Do